MRARLCLSLAWLASALTLALAENRFAPIPREPVPVIACYCRTIDGPVEMGETSCLRVEGRTELARCDMVLNNPSWTLLHRPCNPELTQ